MDIKIEFTSDCIKEEIGDRFQTDDDFLRTDYISQSNLLVFEQTFATQPQKCLVPNDEPRKSRLSTSLNTPENNQTHFMGCGERLAPLTARKRHRLSHEPTIKCQTYDRILNSKTQTKAEKSLKLSKGRKPFKCSSPQKSSKLTTDSDNQQSIQLNEEFTTTSKYQLRRRRSPQKSLELRKKNSDTSQSDQDDHDDDTHTQLNKYSCQDKQSKERVNKWICDYIDCNKQFGSRYYLKDHQRIHSFTPIVHKCELCGAVFKFKYRVKEHYKWKHTNERPFGCHLCSKNFKFNSELNRHIRRHERKLAAPDLKTERVFKYKCEWPGCDYITKLNCHLNRHRISHQSENTIACEWPECHKMFKSLKLLAEHKKIHKRDKVHSCEWPECGYKSVNKSNFNKHIYKHNITNGLLRRGKRAKNKLE